MHNTEGARRTGFHSCVLLKIMLREMKRTNYSVLIGNNGRPETKSSIRPT